MDDGYDVLDGRDLVRRDDPFGPRKIAYPPRLMVDFTSIGVQALQRYARFYNLKLDGALEQADLAALVARHFDASLEVEEHESIATFVQRLRNGERSAAKRTLDKDRKAVEKKRKKSSSRKRPLEPAAASSAAAGGQAAGHAGTSNGGHHAAPAPSSGHQQQHHQQQHHQHQHQHQHQQHHEKDKGTAGSSSGGAAGGASKPTKRSAAKKKDNENEDNELYCICNLPSYGNMIACDGKKCPNPSQWYHLECVGLADGRHPDTWLCPECDPKGFAAFQSQKKKKTKHRSKSPAAK